MKSQNELVITGTIVSDVPDASERTAIRFRLAHNFGGGKETLFLPCVVFMKPTVPLVPGKGTEVEVHAYLRSYKGKIEAVVKSIIIK